MAIESIDLTLCTGCGICAEACPMDVIRFDPDSQEPRIAYPESCIFCFLCETWCPSSCIEVKPTVPRSIPDPYVIGGKGDA
jgi:NAD-dependent dihydropyrimidine dehydrogenase PreA subunit